VTPRPVSRLLVNALTRRVHAEGGAAAVLARGHDEAGAILILALERGANPRFFERGMGPDGRSVLIESGPRDNSGDAAATDYWQRRCHRDPDLWVVELDVAEAERFAADTLVYD
jgi:hypothetical protein